MIVAVGVDEATVERFARMLREDGASAYARICTGAEQAWCESQARPHEALAARWAAKEAVAKCLGTGFSNGVAPRSIEVVRDETGRVSVLLHGAAADAASESGIVRVHLSMSHSEHRAIAFAVAEGAANGR